MYMKAPFATSILEELHDAILTTADQSFKDLKRR
jgi:hypothetical protein